MKRCLLFFFLVSHLAFAGITISPGSIAFGNQVVGATTINQQIVLTNTSGSTLTITSIVTSGGDFADIDACPDILLNGDYCRINVTFTPTTTGARTGTITFTDSDGTSPQTVSLTGSGIPANRTFYMSVTGSNSNSGTRPNPLAAFPGMPGCTLNCAAITPQPGDVYNIRQQLWDVSKTIGTWNWQWSGAAGNPISIQTDPQDGGNALYTGAFVFPSTWVDDANDAKEPICTIASHCHIWYNKVNPATYKFHIALFYNGERRKRAGITAQNGCPNTNTPPMCVPGPTQAQADAQAGCPAGVAALPAPYNHCTSQTPPCSGATPWQVYNKAMYQGTDVDPTWHNFTAGALDWVGIEKWTQSRLKIIGGGGGVANFSGPGFAAGGSNNGCMGVISRSRYLIQNIREKLTRQTWVLDTCPEQDDPVHCNGSQTTPSTIAWRVIYGADESGCGTGGTCETPNTDTVTAPQFDPNSPQLFKATGVSYVNLQNFSFQQDNDQPGCPSLIGADCTLIANNFGWPDQQGMPLERAAVEFVDSDHIVEEGMQHYNIQGWCGPWFDSTVAGGTHDTLVENGTKYGCGAGGVKYGHVGQNTDTNTNISFNNTIQNEAISHNNRIQLTGEATGCVYYGDARGMRLFHLDCFGHIVGAINCGHWLNRGATGGDTAGFTYDNEIAFINATGEGQGGNQISLMHDFGGVYCASNLSSLAPTLGKPTISPYTYSTSIKWSTIGDFGSDWTMNWAGVKCLYFDQGNSATLARFLVLYRCAHHLFSPNLSSHGNQGNQGAMGLQQWNLLQYSILIGCGAKEYANPGCINPGGTNQALFESDGNIYLINSLNNEKNQVDPGMWGSFNYSDITITAGGNSFNSEPTLTVPTCVGTPPVLAPAISYESGTLLWGTIVNPGSGCPAGNQTVAIAGGGGAAATATACTSGGHLVSCMPSNLNATKIFNYGSTIGNQYWDLATTAFRAVTCTTPTSCQSPGGRTVYNGIPWGPLSEEDTHSTLANPNFTDFTYPANLFIPSVVPTGFPVWNIALAGRQHPVINIPNVPNPWPLQTINANTDYLGGTGSKISPQTGISQQTLIK
jgi:hypothetical protein